MGKHLNALEKEYLIRLYRGNPQIKIREFCSHHDISDGAFKKWLKQYDEGGLEGSCIQSCQQKSIESFLQVSVKVLPD